MVVNDYACKQDKRGVPESIAGKPAPTGARNIPTCTAPRLPPPANTLAVLLAMTEVSVRQCLEQVSLAGRQGPLAGNGFRLDGGQNVGVYFTLNITLRGSP
jgi:hypothetical protein